MDSSDQTINNLKEKRALAYHQLLKYHELKVRAQKVYQYYLNLYVKNHDVWLDTDRQLAMLDGRYHEVAAGLSETKETKRKQKELPDLTPEQIDRLCKKFGIELPKVEDE